MKGKFDDIWDDMCADIEAKKVPKQEIPDTVDLSKIGEQMEKAALEAFKKAAASAGEDPEDVEPEKKDPEEEANNLEENNEEDL